MIPSLLIFGSPCNDIDVYIEPLINHLQVLFEQWVEMYDAYAEENFTLQVVVLWIINDYLALGTLCGCPNSGYKGCVMCRKNTHSIRLPKSKK